MRRRLLIAVTPLGKRSRAGGEKRQFQSGEFAERKNSQSPLNQL
jgi:hypothetical protein